MNSFNKNSKDFNRAINSNVDREIREAYLKKNYHEIKQNFPDRCKKSDFEKDTHFFNKHKQAQSKYSKFD